MSEGGLELPQRSFCRVPSSRRSYCNCKGFGRLRCCSVALGIGPYRAVSGARDDKMMTSAGGTVVFGLDSLQGATMPPGLLTCRFVCSWRSMKEALSGSDVTGDLAGLVRPQVGAPCGPSGIRPGTRRSRMSRASITVVAWSGRELCGGEE